MNIKSEFSKLCKIYGMSNDLIQAGGGNISVKDGNTMYIKASGCMLFDVEENKNYVEIDWQNLKKDLTSNNLKELDSYKLSDKKEKPSIETYFHALCNKYVVHLHPISVVAAMGKSSFKEELLINDIIDFEILDYKKPGLEISLEIAKTKLSKVIFLKNHGVIFHCDDLSELNIMIEKVLKACDYMINYNSSFYTQKFLSEYWKENFGYIPYILPLDNEIIALNNVCPDEIVYLNQMIYTDKIDKLSYVSLYGLPSIIYYNKKYYAINKNYIKCKQIEDVLKFNNKLNNYLFNSITNSLSQTDINDIKNWDAEKYRKDV